MQHPPYPITAYLGDILWIVCFTTAFLLATVSNLRWRFLLCAFIVVLLFTRFWLVRFTLAEPQRLPTELFDAELPVQAAMCFYAGAGLLGFKTRLKQAGPPLTARLESHPPLLNL